MTNSVSISQAFLSQIMLETEQEVWVNSKYESVGDVFDVGTFMLSSAFRFLMETLGQHPEYGIAGSLKGEVAKAVLDIRYDSMTDEQRAVVDEQGRILGMLLKDTPARLIILGLISAYSQMENNSDEAVSEDAGGDAGDRG